MSLNESPKKKPDVTVVMPVYNAEEYVREAVESILLQTFGNFELIIVDDHSTDCSLSVLNSIHDPRVQTLSLDTNRGYPSATNVGIAHARGRYIARMDADDVVPPNRLERQVNFLETHPEYVFVGSLHSYLTPRGKLLSKTDLKPSARSNNDAFWIEEDWRTVVKGTRLFADASVMFRRDIATQAGLYRDYQRSGQDIDLWLRMLEIRNKAATINEVLYYQRLTWYALSDHGITRIGNPLVRRLALERKETGTDRVMRGEPLHELMEFEPNRGNTTNLSRIWQKANICFRAKDYRSGFRFMFLALKDGRLSKSNMKGFLRFLKQISTDSN